MTVTQVLGAKVQPTFADPTDWNNTRTYAPLTVVLHEGNSFTSKQYVPVGIDITNTDFWAETGNYNAQIEAYRKEVTTYDDRITTNANAIATEKNRAIAAEKINANAIDILKVKNESFVTPEMYGAVGNGVDDDSNALIEAFNSGKYVVLKPDTTYAIKSTINLSELSKFHVEGNNSTIKYSGTETQQTSIDSIVTIRNSSNVYIKGVVFNANCKWVERPLYENTGDKWNAYTAERSKALGGLSLFNVTNYQLIDCAVRTSLSGFVISNCNNGRIIGGYSDRTLADVIAVRDKTDYLYVYGFKAYYPQDDCFDAIGYGTETPATATNYPTHIIYDSCSVDAGRGAMFCFEGSRYCQAVNCVSTNMRFTPIKLGSYVEPSGKYGCPGKYQLVSNCQFHTINPIVSNKASNILPLIWTCVNTEYVTDDNKASHIKIDNCVFETVNESTEYNTKAYYAIDHVSNCEVSNCTFIGRNVRLTAIDHCKLTNNTIYMPMVASYLTDCVITGNTIIGDGVDSFMDVYYNLTDCTVDNISYVKNSDARLFKHQASNFLATSDSIICANNRIGGGFISKNYTNTEFIGIPYTNPTAEIVDLVKPCIVKSVIDEKLYTNKSGSWVLL